MSSLRTRRKARQQPKWAPEEIRAATPFPKPEGEIKKALGHEAGCYGDSKPLADLERGVLRRIAQTADIIDAGMNGGHELPRHWLLVPAQPDLVEFLATFECEREDMDGGDSDREPEETDAEHDGSEPDDGDQGFVEARSPDLVRPRQVRRTVHRTLKEWQPVPRRGKL